jgi:hypothetical protein
VRPGRPLRCSVFAHQGNREPPGSLNHHRSSASARRRLWQLAPLSLFDDRDLGEITAPEFPGERLMVCKNPLLAEERARKREDLLHATEAALTKLADQITRGARPRGTDRIARAVGRIENRFKLAKLFDITVGDDRFTFARSPLRIAEEARLEAFMSSAPASRTKPWRPRAWSAPIRASPASSAPSAVSRPSIVSGA